MQDQHLNLLLLGLAAGDGLGSTSEFVPQWQIPELYEKLKHTGWPFRAGFTIAGFLRT